MWSYDNLFFHFEKGVGQTAEVLVIIGADTLRRRHCNDIVQRHLEANFPASLFCNRDIFSKT